MALELYSYFRSSASYRVRIALHLKGLPFNYNAVHLVNNGGEQNREEYRALNPMGEVPTLVDGDFRIAQSMAIISYLDDLHPDPRLFPAEPKAKARVIQMCEAVNASIQPLQNLKVLQELEHRYGADQTAKESWVQLWVGQGFKGLEALVAEFGGTYCFGGRITAADCFLIPQVVTAKRFQVDLAPYPCLRRVFDACTSLEAFQKADPTRQPDSPKS